MLNTLTGENRTLRVAAILNAFLLTQVQAGLKPARGLPAAEDFQRADPVKPPVTGLNLRKTQRTVCRLP